MVYNQYIGILQKIVQSNKLYRELCEKTFTQHGNLSRHMKTLHEGLKHSYELCCDKCEKTFTQHGSLSRHKKTVHEGLRYSCEYCQDKLSQSCKLSQHITNFHCGN